MTGVSIIMKEANESMTKEAKKQNFLLLYNNAYMCDITCKFHKPLPTYVRIRTEIKFLHIARQNEQKFVEMQKIKTQGNNSVRLSYEQHFYLKV